MHTLHCPHCSARYSVPAEKLGKRVKCAKCGKRFELALPVTFDELGFPELVPGQALPTIQPPYPTSPSPRTAMPRGPGDSDDRLPAGGLGGYFRDLLGFFRMIAHPSDLATMFVVCGICLLQILTRFGGPMGMMGTAIIRGWFMSFLLRTVQGGAARDNALPDFSLSEGLLEDVIKPSASFLAVRLFATLPLIGTLIFAARDGRIDFDIALLFGFFGALAPELALMAALTMGDQVPGLLSTVLPALLLGLAAMPMLLLVVALEGVESLLRIDLMLATIVRTLPGYFVATSIYFSSILLPAGASYAIELALAPAATSAGATGTTAPGQSPRALPPNAVPATNDPNTARDPNAAGIANASPTAATQRFAGSLLGEAVALLLHVLASVYAMRAIGLYYAHFKRGFAFEWG